MAWTENEITLARKLQQKGLEARSSCRPERGSVIATKAWPSNAASAGGIEIADGLYIVIDPQALPEKYLWLPSFDECLSIGRSLSISFAQITDYLHRKRFADGREREGLYQLLLECLR